MAELLDEKTYRERAKVTLRAILDAFEDIDVDDADVESTGDVIHIRFRGGGRCVVNTQGPTRQLWLAGDGRGWHFSLDGATGKWLDEKGTGDELFAVLTRITEAAIGMRPAFV